MIQVYTGEGKGKTTAALGLALRASGAKLNIYIAQFAKGKECSELEALKKFKNIKLEQFGSCRFIRKVTKNDLALAQKGFAAIKSAVKSKKYQLIVLDEINVALKLKLLKLEDVITFLKSVPCNIEIVLTGRSADPQIVELAHLVSEVKEVKHYFKKGIQARKGIEY